MPALPGGEGRQGDFSYEEGWCRSWVGGASPPLAGSAYCMTSPAKFDGQGCLPYEDLGLSFCNGNLAILSTSSGKSMPRALAPIGTRLREVMPGSVFTSRQ